MKTFIAIAHAIQNTIEKMLVKKMASGINDAKITLKKIYPTKTDKIVIKIRNIYPPNTSALNMKQFGYKSNRKLASRCQSHSCFFCKKSKKRYLRIHAY